MNGEATVSSILLDEIEFQGVPDAPYAFVTFKIESADVSGRLSATVQQVENKTYQQLAEEARRIILRRLESDID